MRIGILGTRGIPARYGGFETLAEELSARLVARGHEVIVYTRTRYAEPGLSTWRGAKIRVLPTIPTKYLDTVVHGVVSGIDAAFERFDAVLVCNAINAAVCFLPRLSGTTRVVLNVDGLERNRRKWNALGKLAYRISETLSTILPDVVVSDARVIQEYYRSRYGAPIRPDPVRRRSARARRGPRRSSGSASLPRSTCSTSRASSRRTTPKPWSAPTGTSLENARSSSWGTLPMPRITSRACGRRPTRGSVPAGVDLRRGVPAAPGATPRVYIQATEVGGTHPALVEALGYGRDRPVQRDARERRGRRRGRAALRRPCGRSRWRACWPAVLDDPAGHSVWKERARQRMRERYRWEDVVNRYETVLDAGRAIP